MLRLLHTADWQIGKQFGGFDPEDAALLADARIKGVRAIAELAVSENVDLVLVAGDVFDQQLVSDKTIRQMFQAMSPFTGHWYLISGNHDAALVESVWTRAQRLGVVTENVHLCMTPEPIEIADGKGVLLPAPLTQRQTFNDATAWFDSHTKDASKLLVGIAHGAVTGYLPDTIDSNNPIDPNRVASAGLDYLAMGDWHGTVDLDRIWYAGSHEQDNFRDNDSGNILLVELELGEKPKVDKRRVGTHRWHDLTFDLRVPTDVDAMEADLSALDAAAVAKVEVTGVANLTDMDRVKSVLGAVQGRIRALRWDLAGLKLEPSQEDIDGLRADGYLSDVLAELRTEQSTGTALAGDALVLLAATLRDVSGTEATA